MGIPVQSHSEDVLNVRQITAYCLAVRMKESDVDLLNHHVFQSDANPEGLTGITLYRLRNICGAVKEGNHIWQEENRYHFLVDPTICDDKLIRLMVLFVDSAKIEVLKSGVLSPQQISAIAECVKKEERLGKSLFFAEALIDPRMTPQNILDAAQLAEQIPRSAMDTVLAYADLNQFRQAEYCNGREDATGVSCLIDAYKKIPAAYRSFAWTDVFFPRSCRVPGYCAAFFRAIKLGLTRAFTEHPKNPELAMELFLWDEAGYADARRVLWRLRKTGHRMVADFFDPVKIMAAYRCFRIAAENKKLPSQQSLYEYHDIELIDELSQAYCKHMIFPEKFSRYFTTEMVENYLNAYTNHQIPRADGGQWIPFYDDSYTRMYRFDYSDCDFSNWDPESTEKLKQLIKRLTVLYAYPVYQYKTTLYVHMNALYHYVPPKHIDRELETEMFFSAGDFNSTGVLISVTLREDAPYIVIYC